MSRDKWHPYGKGYLLWLGNGLYAEIRPVEHAIYTKRGKRMARVAFDLGDGLERCESCGCH